MIPRRIPLACLLLLAVPAHAASPVEALLNNPVTGPQALATFQKRAQQDNYEVCVQKGQERSAKGQATTLTPDYCRCVADSWVFTREEFIALTNKQPVPAARDKMAAAKVTCDKRFGHSR